MLLLHRHRIPLSFGPIVMVHFVVCRRLLYPQPPGRTSSQNQPQTVKSPPPPHRPCYCLTMVVALALAWVYASFVCICTYIYMFWANISNPPSGSVSMRLSLPQIVLIFGDLSRYDDDYVTTCARACVRALTKRQTMNVCHSPQKIKIKKIKSTSLKFIFYHQLFLPVM